MQKNGPSITHTSFGDGKFKGKFCFPDPEILYRFILNSDYRSKYLFVEYRTEKTIAYFDIDFKLQKHGLEKYLPEERIEEFANYIIAKICDELGDDQYVYSDKTYGQGLHLYFPRTIVTKKELMNHMDNIVKIVIRENMMGWTTVDDIPSRICKYVLDKSACNNGVALMFQEKNGSYYKINMEKSTYREIPDDPMSQLKLCQLRR